MTIGDDGIASICMGKDHEGNPCVRCGHVKETRGNGLISRHDIHFAETEPNEAGAIELRATLVLYSWRVFQPWEVVREPEKEIIRQTLIHYLENIMYGDARKAARDFLYFVTAHLPRDAVAPAQRMYDEMLRAMKIGDD